jgi:methylglutaconyl-CoA hydratase
MTAPGLAVNADGAVLTVRLERPPGNLLTTAMCQELTALLRDPPDGAHVLHLTAEGESFCLGRDRAAGDPDGLRAEVGALVALNRALDATRLVTVAEVSGDAAGFGAGLAALCRIAVAAPSVRLWFPEVEVGLAPTVVLTWLPRRVGRRLAFDLTATGRRLTAAEAAQAGLLTAVAPGDAALPGAVAERIAALTRHPARVHAEIAAFIDAAADLTTDAAYELATDRLVLSGLRPLLPRPPAPPPQDATPDAPPADATPNASPDDAATHAPLEDGTDTTSHAPLG